jgi:hypothetical protein
MRNKTWLCFGTLAAALAGIEGCSDEVEPKDSCFDPDTRVAIPGGGTRAIGTLEVGDEVMSADPVTGAAVARRVLAVLRSDGDDRIDLDAGGAHLRGVTPQHPFWVASRAAWVVAAELREGDVLSTLEGEALVPRAIESLSRRRAVGPVINLSVEGPEHTFFVEGILVHNKSYFCPECVPIDAGGEASSDAANGADAADASCTYPETINPAACPATYTTALVGTTCAPEGLNCVYPGAGAAEASGCNETAVLLCRGPADAGADADAGDAGDGGTGTFILAP